MSGADLETGICIERARENQMRQRDRRFERVTDDIVQHAIPLEPPGGVELCRALRMDENQRAELFGLGPERMKFRIRQFLAIDAAADDRAAQSEWGEPNFERLGSEIRVLQGNRRQTDKPVRLCRADLVELLILQ